MADLILVLNAGSSSLKFSAFDARASLALVLRGQIEGLYTSPRFGAFDARGADIASHRWGDGAALGHEGAIGYLAQFLRDHGDGHRLLAAGHRVVHGGLHHVQPARVTTELLASLRSLTPLAPLHQPRCLAPVRRFTAIRPALTQIACFDTAFHHGLAPPASRFAIPRRFEARGVRRYGFHGLSFEYVAGRLAEIAPELAGKRTVIAHLGNGASLCALRDGRSIDTTMGLTPLDGLVMGTRSGTIDPGVLLYLQQHENMSIEDVQHLLYHESGLFGVSGLSADMRTLLASSEVAAREAVDLFVFRAAQQIAMMATTLKGLDCLVFTGGIGEHAKEIRGAIGERLAWLGVRIDAAANDEARERIGGRGSAVEVFVIPTNEEQVMARHCVAMLRTKTQVS